jgi:hypothetical protein
MFDFESSLGQLKERSKYVEVNGQTIMIIVKYAMEIIEVTELKGTEQKEMAIKLVKKLVEDIDLDENVKKVINGIIESGALSVTIDLIIDASKGNLNINLKKKLKKFCCA